MPEILMKPEAEFDRYADNYSELLRIRARDGFVQSGDFYHRRKWDLISGFLSAGGRPPAQLSWLDVGCGKGELLRYGRSSFGRVAGCDPSREMSRNAGDLEVRLQEDPETLPFPSETFDFVTAVCVYHHVPEPHRIPLTRDISRVLRRGGVFSMIEHNPFNPVTRWIVSQCEFDADARLLSGRMAKEYARQAELRALELRYFLYLPETLYNKAASVERLGAKIPLGGQYAMFATKD